MLTENEREHLIDIIEREVSFFNGWAVTQETQRNACEKAATKARRYLEKKLKDHYRKRE